MALKQFLFYVIFCFCTLISQSSFAKASQEKAEKYLFDQIVIAKVYDSWTNPEKCLGIQTELQTTRFFDFAVVEIHSADCNGDTATIPVIDRFRVSRSNKKILWHDMANDKFLPFQQFIALRKSGSS